MRALAVAAALLALAGEAQAEPISIGVALVSSFLATSFTVAGVSVSVGTLVQIGLIAGGLAAQALLGARAGSGSLQVPQSVDPGAAKNTFDEAEGYEIFALGRVRLGGLKAFGNTVGTNRWRLIWHCRGPIDGIEAWYLGGRPVRVESNGEVSDPPYALADGSYIYIASKLGADNETSWSQLQSAFPALWTSNHRARGVAQSLVNYISPGLGTARFGAMYQNGAPDLQVVLRGALLYDPRTLATAWSDNGVLAVLHVALWSRLFELADFDLAFVGAEATRADAVIASLTGTRKRAVASGVWTGEAKPIDIVQQVLDSVGAQIVRRADGKWGIALIDEAPVAQGTITADSIVDLKIRSGPESVERPNLCRVSYYAPEREYEIAEIDMSDVAWASIDDEIARVGEHVLELKMPFCPSASQAQRLARRTFAMRRADSGVLVTNLSDMPAWHWRYVDLELVDLEETVLVELGAPRIDDKAATVEFPFVVVPDLPAWVPASDEAPAPVSAGFQGMLSPIATPATPTQTCLVVRPDTGAYEVRALISIPVGATGGMRARYRFASGGSGTMSVDIAGTTKLVRLAGDSTGQTIFIRVRGHNTDNMVSLWSPEAQAVVALNTTPPAAPTLVIEVVPFSGSEDQITIRATTTGQIGAIGIKITGPDVYPSPGDVTTYLYGGPDLELTRVLVVPNSGGPVTLAYTARVIASGPTDGTAASASHIIPT